MDTPAPRRRGALVVLTVAAAMTCLLLGWWQWSRFESGGTGQNLGYALQWPLFAGFCVYAYRKFVRLEADESSSEASADPAIGRGPTELPEGLLPARPTATAADADPKSDYNAYLAQLSAQDADHASRSSR